MTEAPLKDAIEIIKEPWRPGEEDTAYIGLEHIKENDLSLNGVGRSGALESNKSRFRAGDILFGKLRPYFRKVVMPNFDGVSSTDIWVMRAREGYDQRFLFYFMANPLLISQSSGASTGTKMPRADWDFLGNTMWSFPTLQGQRSIAAILSSLDKKVDVLRRQNQTLEQIVQEIFNEWFRTPISAPKPPDGWREYNLGELATFVPGYSYKGTDLVESSLTGMVNLKNFDRTGGFRSDGLKPLAGSPKESQEVRLGDVVLAYTDITQDAAVLGNAALILDMSGYERLYISTDVAKVEPKGNLTSAFLYFLLKTGDFKRYCVAYANGTTVLHLPRAAVPEYKVMLPNDLRDPQISGFATIAESIVRKMIENTQQERTLVSIRETLLPRLMAGELRVPEDK